MNRITRFFSFVFITTLIIFAAGLFNPNDLLAETVNCEGNPESDVCNNDGYTGPTSGLDARFSNNSNRMTVQAGGSVTVSASDVFGSSLDTSCPSTTVEPAFSLSTSGWYVPANIYNSVFSGSTSFKRTLTTRQDWNGDGLVSSDPDSAYFDEVKGWTYEGIEIDPVLYGTDQNANGVDAWQKSGNSISWSFNAPTPSETKTYTFRVSSGDALDKFYNAFDCNTGDSYHDYSIGGVEGKWLFLTVEAPPAPPAPPAASLSVAKAGESSFGSSVTVTESSSASNATFRAQCENSTGALVGLEVNEDVPGDDLPHDYLKALSSVGTNNYTLTCTPSVGDSVNSSVQVTVEAEPDVPVVPTEPAGEIRFTNSSITVNEGEIFTLSWTSANIAGSLSKTGTLFTGTDTANVADSQNIRAPQVSSNTTSSYTLSGEGEDGDPVSVTEVVTVNNVPKGTINVSHNGSSDYTSGTYSISPSIVSNASLARGGSASYTVSPASSGTQYTFTAVATGDGPYISINGGQHQLTNAKTFVVADGDTVNVDFYYIEEPTTGNLVVTSTCPVTTTYSFSGTGTPSSESNQSLTSGGTRSHSISMSTSNVTYSVSAASPEGYTASVSPTSASISVGGSQTFTISCVEDAPEATVSVTTLDPVSTGVTLRDAGGNENLNGTVVGSWNNSTNSINVTLAVFTVSPTNGSEVYTLSTSAPASGYEYVITNSAGGGSSMNVSDGGDYTFTIDRRGLAGWCTLTPDKTSVSSGETYTLTWTGENLSFATAQNSTPAHSGWTQQAVSTAGGSVTVTAPQLNPGESVTYSHPLLCGYRNGTRETVSAQVTVSEPANPMTINVSSNEATTFTVIPDPTGGQMTNASITAGGTKSFTFDSSTSGTTYTIIPAQKESYTESVSSTVNGSPAGSSSASGVQGDTIGFTLSYIGDQAVSIEANPEVVELGGDVELAWDTLHVSSCTASGSWSGVKGTSGNETVTPASEGEHTYTLTCDGISDSAVVTVSNTAVTVDINANPTDVETGNSTSLTWTSENADSCTASGSWSGAKSTSGTQLMSSLSEGQKNYILTCIGAGGQGSDSVQVSVVTITQCNDGVDNDGDGLTDSNDPDCGASGGDSEFPPAECNDGFDNDGDGDVDMNDSSCSSTSDNDETNPMPQFSLSVSPSSIALPADATESESAQISISSLGGYTENVTITAEYVGETPAGISLIFPSEMPAGSVGYIYVEAIEGLETAEYTIRITAVGNLQDGSDLVISRNITLQVEGGDNPSFEEF